MSYQDVNINLFRVSNGVINNRYLYFSRISETIIIWVIFLLFSWTKDLIGKVNKNYLTWYVGGSYASIAAALQQADNKAGIKDLTIVWVIFIQCKQWVIKA